MNFILRNQLAIIIMAITVLTGCRKKEEMPLVTTISVTNINGSDATSGGEIIDEGGSQIIARGVCYGTMTKPTIADNKTMDGTGSGSFTSNLTGLGGNMNYYARAYATNSAGTGYGMSVSFISFGQPPNVLVTDATIINQSMAILNGKVNTNNLQTTVIFEYGTTANYERSVNASSSPLQSGTSPVNAEIAGLIPATKYHFRIKAVNSLGMTYGNDMTFTTVLTDVEGNNYKVITIGTQIWMQENLKTAKYNNGEIIGTTFSPTLDITNEIRPKYQWDSNTAGYGRQYTYYALTDERKVCPAGWHVPTDAEWTTLTDYLIEHGYGYEGSGTDIAKSLAAASGWISDLVAGNIGNDQEKNNSSGFTGLAAGGRYSNGVSSFVGYHGIWGTSTESSETSAFFRCIGYVPGQVFRGVFNKSYGLSIRCLRD